MENSVFVGREAELRQLRTYLDSAAAGKAQVVFIAGEAGAGKSSLVAEFVRRAEEADPRLISSTGECNAQTGIADPYLPFRQVLTALTTGNEAGKSPKESDQTKKLSRWKEFVQVSSKTLIMLGPDLVGIFVPGASLLTRIGTTIALNSNLASKLSEQVGKKLGKENPKIDPALDQEKIFEQYAAVLKGLARDHTLVLVLDDLQWADSGSVNLLFYLGRQLKDSRVLLVGTYRPDDVALGRDDGRHPLESILNELKRYNGDIVINLALTEAREGRAFVDALVDAEPNHLESSFRDELFAHTGGHPLFTVELLRNLEECGNLVKDAQGNWVLSNKLDWKTLPARIEGVIGERIARLPSDLHETLTIGSVIGQEFAAQVVGTVQKVNERELVRNLSRELEKRYMLVVELGEIKIGRQFLSQYRFAHYLLQQYLYDELSSGERRMLHSEIAETLESLYSDQKEQIALQLARHYEAAGEDAKAIAYLIIAGDSAFGVYAYPEAIAAYTRSLESGEQGAINPQQLSHVYLRRGRALELSNHYDLALKNYEAMLAAAQKRQDKAMELAAKVAASTLYSTATPVADAGKAQRLAEETLILAKELGDRPSEAKVLWNLQLVNLLQNKALEAIGYGEKSLAIARELNLREQMAYALSDLGWAYIVACQFDQADKNIEEGASLWRELGNLPMLSNNLILSLFGLFWAGKNEEVLRVAEESYQLSSSIKEVWNQALARNFQGLVRIDYGEIDQGLATLEESVRLAAQGNRVYELWYSAVLLQVYGDLGAADLVMDRYRTLRVANRDVPHTPARSGTLIAYAMYELTSGQLEAATNTLNDCSPDAIPWETLVRMAKCRLALARADFTEAVALADAAVDLARQNKLGHHLAEALFLKGKTHFNLGDRLQAKNTLEQALSEAEKLGSRYLLWQIIAILADIETDKDLSIKLRAEARQIVDDIANHITRQDLRQAFLRSTMIYAALEEK
jgi:predicted ATPase